MISKSWMKAAAAAFLTLAVGAARAAEINGAAMSVAWGIPFVGMLLSIALMPLLLPQFWHHHFGKVTAGWALAFLLPLRWSTAWARRA